MILAISAILSSTAFACEICGCSHGGYFVGSFPDFRRHFIGVRYSYRSYFSHVDTSQEFSRDRYQSLELWGGWSLGRRWQVMVFLPFNANKQETDDGGHHHTHYGFGDLTLMANYMLLKHQRHQLWTGGGVKLPTGKFQPEAGHELVPAANMEPGSGSTDLVFTATDVVTAGKWSLYSNANYTVNREAKGFQFGNRLSGSVLGAFTIQGAKQAWIPNAGFYYEHFAANRESGSPIAGTGGQSLQSTLGLDIRFSRMNLGMNVQLPLAQQISDNQTHGKFKGMLQLIFPL